MTTIPSLVERAKAGDRAAFDALYDPLRGLVASTYTNHRGATSVGRHIEPDDLVQEVALIAWKRIASCRYGDDAGFRRWVAQIAHNLFVTWVRRGKNTYEVPLDPAMYRDERAVIGHGTPGQDDPDARADWSSTVSLLDLALCFIPRAEAATIRTYATHAANANRLHADSYAAVARYEGVSTSTVRSRLNKARARLGRIFPSGSRGVLYAETQDAPLGRQGHVELPAYAKGTPPCP